MGLQCRRTLEKDFEKKKRGQSTGEFQKVDFQGGKVESQTKDVARKGGST